MEMVIYVMFSLNGSGACGEWREKGKEQKDRDEKEREKACGEENWSGVDTVGMVEKQRSKDKRSGVKT